MAFCPNCGNEIDEEDQFCKGCGSKINSNGDLDIKDFKKNKTELNNSDNKLINIPLLLGIIGVVVDSVN